MCACDRQAERGSSSLCLQLRLFSQQPINPSPAASLIHTHTRTRACTHTHNLDGRNGLVPLADGHYPNRKVLVKSEAFCLAS